MGPQNAEGIILRKYYLRETSYILSVFTKDFGKIKGVIKGVRSPFPQFAGNFEPFTKCQLLFYRKKKRPLDLITGCETLDYFLPLRKDIERVTYANYFTELVDITTVDNDVNRELYDILVKGFKLLETDSSPRRVSRIFEIKFLKAIGFEPHLESCVKCSASIEKKSWFSVSGGGIICDKCYRRGVDGNLGISMGTVNFLRKVQSSEIEKTSILKVSREVGEETEKVLNMFLRYHIAKPIKSLKFLSQMNEQGVI